MKVLFVNAPWFEKNSTGVRAGTRWAHTEDKKSPLKYVPFPFSLSYAAAVLEEADIKVNVIDAIADNLDEGNFLNRVRKYSPDLIVMECSTPSIEVDFKNAEKIKNMTDSNIVFVGNHVSALPKEVLCNKNVDFGLIGEYDYTLRELVLNFDDRKKYPKILGLAFKEKNTVHVNERRPLINIDELPLPARHLFHMEKYNETFCERYPNIQMLASRGCPFSCIFCIEPWTTYNHTYRARSVPLVLEEMDKVIKDYKPKEIYFDDSTFTVSEKRTIDLCNGIIENDFNIPWSCMTTANCIRTKKMLEKMSKAGCERIKIGLESADEEVLKKTGKPYDLEHVKKALRWAKECDIGVHITVMVGLPGETKSSVEKTIRYVENLAKEGLIQSTQSSFAVPFPGTKFYTMAIENGWLLTKEWSKYDGSCGSIVSYPRLTTEEIVQLKTKVNEHWRYCSMPYSLLFRKVRRLCNQRGVIVGSWLSLKRAIDYVFHKTIQR
jgi:radical SAM superfamily enzyme YgiQ (UPF0313 family)